MKRVHFTDYFDPAKYTARTGVVITVDQVVKDGIVVSFPDGAPNPALSDYSAPVKPEAAITAIKAGSVNAAHLSAYLKWLAEVRND